MKTKIGFKQLILFVMLILNVRAAYAQQTNSVAGIWVGDLIVNENVKLLMAFEITENEDKSISALMHSLDQNAFDITVQEISVEGAELKMSIKSLNSVFNGKIESKNLINGSLTQGKNSPWIINLNKVDKLPVERPKRPQEPQKPYPYYVEDITFRNEPAGITLAGTFTRPLTENQYPVVLLISGSGPNGRDAEIFGHKVFLVWADILTRAGIAVLRVDDRGTGESTGNFHKADIRDLADDVVAGVEYLKTRADVDVNRIGLMGHSLGADIAPMAAVKSADVKFVVLMAGVAISFEENIHEQCRAVYQQLNVSEKGIQLNQKINEMVYDIVKTEQNDSIARIKIAENMKSFHSDLELLNEHDANILELSLPLNLEEYYQWLHPARKFGLFYNPYNDLSKLKCPVLALNGDKDVQVLAHNLNIMEKAFIEAGNTHYTIKLWENKNHLFQTCQTGSVREYKEIEETISMEVMDFVINWIENKF